jgi:hypothetical protein
MNHEHYMMPQVLHVGEHFECWAVCRLQIGPVEDTSLDDQLFRTFDHFSTSILIEIRSPDDLMCKEIYLMLVAFYSREALSDLEVGDW